MSCWTSYFNTNQRSMFHWIVGPGTRVLMHRLVKTWRLWPLALHRGASAELLTSQLAQGPRWSPIKQSRSPANSSAECLLTLAPATKLILGLGEGLVKLCWETMSPLHALLSNIGDRLYLVGRPQSNPLDNIAHAQCRFQDLPVRQGFTNLTRNKFPEFLRLFKRM